MTQLKLVLVQMASAHMPVTTAELSTHAAIPWPPHVIMNTLPRSTAQIGEEELDLRRPRGDYHIFRDCLGGRGFTAEALGRNA